MKKGVFMMCKRVTWSAVAIPVVIKAVDTRYWVMAGSKLNAPEAIARGGETIEPIMVKAC